MRFRRDGRHFAAAVIAWYCSLKKSSQIAVAVCIAHFIAILWMSVDYSLAFQPKKHSPMIVRSIQIPPIHVKTAPHVEAPSVAVAQKIIPKPSPAPKTQAIPLARKESKKSSQPSKKIIAKQPAKKAQNNKSLPIETVHQIEEGFASLVNTPIKKKSADIALPQMLESKSAVLATVEETIESPIVSTYHLSLVSALQSSLVLPELGEVRIKISIESPGKIALIEILDTRSMKNADWLKNQLPLLELPCFNDFGIVDATLEFTITFRNAENI